MNKILIIAVISLLVVISIQVNSCRLNKLNSQIIKTTEKELKDTKKEYDLFKVDADKNQKLFSDTITIKEKEIVALRQSYSIRSQEIDQIKLKTSKEMKAAKLTLDQVLVEDEKKDSLIVDLKNRDIITQKMIIDVQTVSDMWKNKFILKDQECLKLTDIISKDKVLIDLLKNNKKARKWLAIGPGSGYSLNGKWWIGGNLTLIIFSL